MSTEVHHRDTIWRRGGRTEPATHELALASLFYASILAKTSPFLITATAYRSATSVMWPDKWHLSTEEITDAMGCKLFKEARDLLLDEFEIVK